VKASVTGNGMAPRGRLILPRARTSARVIRSHRSQEHRWVRFSRCAAHSPKAAAKSLAMNGICPSKASACAPLNWVSHCT
jgi:hypothetical protein